MSTPGAVKVGTKSGWTAGQSATWLGSAITALVVMLAPRWIAGAVLFVAAAFAVYWLGWSCMTDAHRAIDDRADLVPREPRTLSRIPEGVRYVQLPPPPRLPRIQPLPPKYALPPLAREVPGSIQGWLRPSEKGIDQ
jgi:hypothetical protein